MIELSYLPASFKELKANPPEGFILSDRVIDPIIIIERTAENINARLAGTRTLKGIKYTYLTLNNNHTWVVDGTTIRPLPNDAATLFEATVQGKDPDSLSYSEAIKLLRDSLVVLPTEPGENFLKAGKVVSDELEGELVIEGLNATLFSYQARGIRWMLETISLMGGLVLADEMGLGKTIQIISLLLIERPSSNAPALIVCPTSLIANWEREFTRFAEDISVLVHRGPNRTGITRGLQKSSVVITTYDTVVNDISIFSAMEWSWVICDEAQAVKNPDSNRRRAIANIPRRKTIPMTGTPVENSLLDLWSLADLAIPGILGSRQEFEFSFPDTIASAKKIGNFTDPMILKRKVEDVAGDLPERLDIDIPLELGDELSDYYLNVRETTLAKYPTAGALVATLQLQLVCAHPWLVNIKSESDDADVEIAPLKKHSLMTPKMERAVALLREAFFNERKVIIFSLFNRIGELLRMAFPEFPNAYWGAINGATPQDERQSIIDNFSAHLGPGCLVLNPRAAGAGLNITAATVVIHFTPVWNPALEAQASARAHRRGQTKPVTIYRLFYKDTVEEVMIERSLWKSELANESIPIATRDAADLKRALEIAPRRP